MRAFSSPGAAWIALACLLATVAPWPAIQAAAAAQAAGAKGRGESAWEQAVNPAPEQAVRPAGAKSEAACHQDGSDFARTDVHTFGNFAGGVGLGLLLPFLGAGIAYAITSKPSVPWDLVPGDQPRQCQLAFIEGYQQQGKAEKRNAAVVGGIVGTTVAILLVAMTASLAVAGD